VPKEPEKDTQLQYALSLLRGTATEAVATPATTQTAEPERKGVPN
jgi:carboxyl-terminal processing protease